MQRQTEMMLSPVQQRALEALLEGIASGDVLTLHGGAGSGKTAILRNLHAEAGGALVRIGDLRPSGREEAFLWAIESALAEHDLVIVDDLHVVTGIIERRYFPRTFILDAALTTILGEASVFRKTLVFGIDGAAPWPIARRARIVAELPS